ncbi:hypothetical protein ACWDA3_25970 [Nonomuraea rubra]
MTQLLLWDSPAVALKRTRRRWVARCDDCGRKIWARDSLRRVHGRRLGGRCRRKRLREARRVTIRIHPTDPGHIPGQLDIEE